MPSPFRTVRRIGSLAALAAVACVLGACHNNNYNTSGYGVAWVTLGSVPAPIFASYIVTVDSVTLTDSIGSTYTALATAEPVDFVKLRDVREIWGSATIPNSVLPGSSTAATSYKAATIVLDYTNADISVIVNGLPQRATVVGVNGNAVATQTVKVNLDPDPKYPFVITPSYSTDNAQLLAINFDLLASNKVNLSTSPATVTVLPFMTVALAPPDNELIRVRGSLVNSSVPIGTFTVYERPFYDQAAAAGQLTIFNNANTLYTLDGVSYSGATGLNALSQLPAGVTMTASYTTFEPTATATAFAGIFTSVYTVGGNSLQSNLTENISGDVIAIAANATTGVHTLTLRGATVYGPLVALAQGYFGYQQGDAQLLVGPSTVVTLDDAASSAGLSYKSIAVGDHVEAVGGFACTGVCGTTGLGVWTIDATAASTGKVRLMPTPIFGQLQTAAAGSLSMALQTINYWPAGDFNFAGNGASAATDPTAASFSVDTGSVDLTGTTAGTPVWISGIAANFGSAPPDFIATSTSLGSGVPATLHVEWTGGGSIAPFDGLVSTGFSVNLLDPHLANAVLQVGAQSTPLNTLSASPQIVTTPTPISITGKQVFSPHYAYSTISTVAGVNVNNVNVFTNFSLFVVNFVKAISLSSPAYELTASGTYDSGTNTFVANTVSVVL